MLILKAVLAGAAFSLMGIVGAGFLVFIGFCLYIIGSIVVAVLGL